MISLLFHLFAHTFFHSYLEVFLPSFSEVLGPTFSTKLHSLVAVFQLCILHGMGARQKHVQNYVPPWGTVIQINKGYLIVLNCSRNLGNVILFFSICIRQIDVKN